MATEDDVRGEFADADVAVSLRTPHLARVTHRPSGDVEWAAVLMQRVSVPAIPGLSDFWHPVLIRRAHLQQIADDIENESWANRQPVRLGDAHEYLVSQGIRHRVDG